MNISVVLCTYNRAEKLRVALRSLSEMRVPPGLRWELLVVDNNSSDHTRQVSQAAAAQLPCRYLFESRQGKSFALNTAIPQALGEIVAFTDDDVTMHHDWLGALWRAFTQHECLGVGGRILAVWNHPKPRWYGDTETYSPMAGVIVEYDHGDVTREIKSPPFGANMAFRREAFTRYGMFRTDLGSQKLMRGEDSEFCERVRDSGERILYVADAVVYHPVVEERLQKQYFQSWYFDYGRMTARVELPPSETIRWFGIPRYMFRNLAAEALAWLTAFEPKKRFFHKLECYQSLGQITESRHLNQLTHRS